MDPDADRRLSEAYWESLQLPEDERTQFLESCLGDDPALLRRAQEMLSSDTATAEGDAYLLALARRVGLSALQDSSASGPPETLPPGRRYGAYRTVALLGRGGMGSVYLAERVDGDFEHQVAIKVVDPALETEVLLERLRRERRVLAGLVHPNIARLYDGGVGPDGEPFLVMEYVEGVPITEHCSTTQAPLTERLRLFLDVAAAVQFAHGRLVVHRDLKPSNVLVTPDSEVKLLDFGISKVLAGASEGADLTLPESSALTPAYAAPEQLRGESVTVATDVFALGILLYELLAGEHPFRDEGSTWDRVAHAVLEHEPASPARRAFLNAPHDLGLICLKAIRKEPERRYASVAEFAADVKRFLAGQPVLARNPTLRYRTTRFVGRHRLAVTAMAFAGIATVLGIGSTVWQARNAASEAERATRINEFVLDLFRASDPTVAQGEALTARQLLDRGAERLDDQAFRNRPTVRAEMLEVLGPVYRELGFYDQARSVLAAALEVRVAEDGGGAATATDVLHELARLEVAEGEYAQADTLYRRVLVHYEGTGRDRDEDRRIVQHELGALLVQRNQVEEGAEFLRQALAGREDESVWTAARVALTLNYADALHRQKKWDEAAAAFQSIAVHASQQSGASDPVALAAVEGFAQQLAMRGDPEAAVPLLLDALAARRRIYGDEHVAVAAAKTDLSFHLARLGRGEEAERMLQEALAVQLAQLDVDHFAVAETNIMLGTLLGNAARYDESIAAFRAAIQGFDVSSEVPNLYSSNARRNMGRVLDHAKRLDEAAREFGVAYDHYVELEGRDYIFAIKTLGDLAGIRLQLGELDTAESLSTQAIEAYERLGRTGRDIAFVIIAKGNVLVAKGEPAAAEAAFVRAGEMILAGAERDHWLVQVVQTNYARLLLEEGRPEEAEAKLLEAYPVLSESRPPAHAYPSQARALLKRLYEQRGDLETAALYEDPGSS